MVNAIIGFHQGDERRVIVCSNNQVLKGAHAAPFALLSCSRRSHVPPKQLLTKRVACGGLHTVFKFPELTTTTTIDLSRATNFAALSPDAQWMVAVGAHARARTHARTHRRSVCVASTHALARRFALHRRQTRVLRVQSVREWLPPQARRPAVSAPPPQSPFSLSLSFFLPSCSLSLLVFFLLRCALHTFFVRQHR
jgi:hypothetical protein